MERRDGTLMTMSPDARLHDARLHDVRLHEGSVRNSGRMFREIAVNGLGLAMLAAMVALGSYTVAAEQRPISTSVSAYAAENGLEYSAPEPAYGRLSETRRAGTGGNGAVDSAAAVR